MSTKSSSRFVSRDPAQPTPSTLALESAASLTARLRGDASLIQALQSLRKTITCSVCLELLCAPVTLPCAHSYCEECISQAVRIREACPCCLRPVKGGQWTRTLFVEQVLVNIKQLVQELDPQAVCSQAFEWPTSINPRANTHSSSSSANNNNTNNNINGNLNANNNTSNDINNTPTSVANAPAASSSATAATTTPARAEQHAAQQQKIVHEVGALVNVLPRTWSGINRLGGVGRVENRFEEGGTCYYRVKYVLDSRHDDNVHEFFVQEFRELDRSSRRRAAAAASPSPSSAAAPVSERESSASKSNKRKFSSPSPMKTNSAATTPSSSSSSSSSSLVAQSSSSALSARDKREREPADSAIAPLLPSSSSALITVLATSIDEGPAFDKKLEKLQELFPSRCAVTTQFSPAATHLVVSLDAKTRCAKQRTMKYMLAVAHGLWIVSTQWVKDCIKQKQLLSESKYEAAGNVKATKEDAPRRARRAREQGRGLLQGKRVLLFGGFPLPGPARSDATTLLSACRTELVCVTAEEFVTAFVDLSKNNDSASSSSERSLNDWLIIVSHCGGYTRELVMDRLVAGLQQVSVGNEVRQYIEAQLQRVRIVDSLWLLDTVTNFDLMPVQSYIVN